MFRTTLTTSASVLIAMFVLISCAPGASSPTPFAATVPGTAAPTSKPPPAPVASTVTVPVATRSPAPTATPPLPAITAAPGAVHIQFWHLFGLQQAVALQRLADQFNAANPGYYLVPVNQGTAYEPLYQKVSAAIAANTLPEMAIGTSADLGDYDRASVLATLDGYIGDPKDGLTTAQLAEIDPALYFDRVNGRTIGLSFSRSAQVMFYNADLLRAAGFTQPPATWDEWNQVCAVVKQPEVHCYAYLPNPTTFAGWVWSRGGEYASADEKKAAFDNPQAVDALTWLKNGAEKKWVYAPSGAFGDQTDFANGKVVFTFASTTALPFYQTAIRDSKQKFAWGIAPFPHGPQGSPVVPILGPSAAVFKTTPEKQRGAWLFLRFLLSPESQLSWTEATTYFPASRSVLDQISGLDSAQVRASNPGFADLLPAYKQATGFLTYGRREPTSPAWRGQPRTVISDMLTAVFSGKTSASFSTSEPAAAAHEAARRVDEALQSYGK